MNALIFGGTKDLLRNLISEPATRPEKLCNSPVDLGGRRRKFGLPMDDVAARVVPGVYCAVGLEIRSFLLEGAIAGVSADKSARVDSVAVGLENVPGAPASFLSKAELFNFLRRTSSAISTFDIRFFAVRGRSSADGGKGPGSDVIGRHDSDVRHVVFAC